MAKAKNKARQEVEDRFVEIDQLALDEEWVKQPELYYKWATKLADARLVLDETEADLKLTEAELDAAIRANPSEFGLDKVTESAVKATIPSTVKYQDAQQEVHSARHRVAVLQAGVIALEHKKRALEKLVDLHGQNYFAAPRSDNNEVMEDMVRKTKRKSYRRSPDED